MTDIFGAVLNAGHLAKKLVVYIDEVRDAPKDIERLRM